MFIPGGSTLRQAIHQRNEQNSAIVNIGSVAGTRWIGSPYIAYSAAKAAVIAMTTDIAIHSAAQRDKLSPTGKMGDAWGTAYAALFLASDEARYVNGVHLPVDGGLMARCA